IGGYQKKPPRQFRRGCFKDSYPLLNVNNPPKSGGAGGENRHFFAPSQPPPQIIPQPPPAPTPPLPNPRPPVSAAPRCRRWGGAPRSISPSLRSSRFRRLRWRFGALRSRRPRLPSLSG